MAPLRTSYPSRTTRTHQTRATNISAQAPRLTSPPGLPRLNPKLHPSLQHPLLHLARLQPHLRRPARQTARARNLAVVAHLRHLDLPHKRDSLLRRVSHQRAGVLPAGHLDVRGCVCALCERVVCVWHDEVGEAACGTGGCEYGEFGVDV